MFAGFSLEGEPRCGRSIRSQVMPGQASMHPDPPNPRFSYNQMIFVGLCSKFGPINLGDFSLFLNMGLRWALYLVQQQHILPHGAVAATHRLGWESTRRRDAPFQGTILSLTDCARCNWHTSAQARTIQPKNTFRNRRKNMKSSELDKQICWCEHLEFMKWGNAGGVRRHAASNPEI